MANIVYANIEECQNKKIYPPNGIFTRDDAINYLEKKFATGQAKEYRIKKVESILDRSLLPHLGDTRDDRIKKASFLGRVPRAVISDASRPRSRAPSPTSKPATSIRPSGAASVRTRRQKARIADWSRISHW